MVHVHQYYNLYNLPFIIQNSQPAHDECWYIHFH